MQTVTLKEWWESKRLRDEEADRLMQYLVVKHCPHCKKKYSFYKGSIDPKMCSVCKGDG